MIVLAASAIFLGREVLLLRQQLLSGSPERLLGVEGRPVVRGPAQALSGDTTLIPHGDDPTVLVGIRSDCPASRAAVLKIIRYSRQHCDIDVVLVSPEDIATLQSYWDTVVDGPECARIQLYRALEAIAFADSYGFHQSPTHILIMDGKVVSAQTGLVDGGWYRRYLEDPVLGRAYE